MSDDNRTQGEQVSCEARTGPSVQCVGFRHGRVVGPGAVAGRGVAEVKPARFARPHKHSMCTATQYGPCARPPAPQPHTPPPLPLPACPDAPPDRWSALLGVPAFPELPLSLVVLADPSFGAVGDLLAGLDFAFPTATKIGAWSHQDRCMQLSGARTLLREG